MYIYFLPIIVLVLTNKKYLVNLIEMQLAYILFSGRRWIMKFYDYI